MKNIGLCEDMSIAWNKQRVLKYLRSKTKEIGSWKRAHKSVYCTIYRVVSSWANIEKGTVILEWFGNIGKNGDNK